MTRISSRYKEAYESDSLQLLLDEDDDVSDDFLFFFLL